MRVPGTPQGCERIAYVLGRREESMFSDTYGGGGDVIGLDCHLVRPLVGSASAGSLVGSASAESLVGSANSVLIFMHPTGGGMYLPIVSGLAKAGHHVIWANSRYRGSDSALIMEKVAADLGAVIVDARERLGYERVVLVGWSGGGSLSLWYQSLAEAAAGISQTAAGDQYEVSAAQIPEADAVLVMAAHISRHGTLTEWMDPSITDESDPFNRDSQLNIYDAANPNQPPYSADFLAHYRQSQIDRNRRITATVKQQLADLAAAGLQYEERAFCVHGTMADPRWLDLTIDPSDRQPNWCYLGDPKVVNDGPVGLARFSTLRSWLSQWSYDDAQADAQIAATNVTVPVLVVGNTADDACTPSHTHRIYQAIAHDRKALHEVAGATHYYGGENGKAHLAEAIETVTGFLDTHLPN